jgi:peptide chain release factor 2
LEALEHQISHPEFWNDSERARRTIARVNDIKQKVIPQEELEARAADFPVFIELAREQGDMQSLQDVADEFAAMEQAMSDHELKLLLSGPFDKGSAFMVIHSGAGGTEACDWADMLMRMYVRYSEQQGWKVDVLDHTPGDEVGTRSATLEIRGENAFGFLSCERGVHRLVRISPFDAAKKRHTSFASIDVTPDSEVDIDIQIRDEDLRIDRYRSGGKGGQNVNKVETAIRITHIPSGVVVACQAERSQGKNQEKAMSMLRAKLYQLEEDKRRAEIDKQYGEKSEIGWGSQIRSYVFQPYQMVKDLRTGEKTSAVDAVMNGALQPFIESKLRGKKAGEDDLDEEQL